MVFFCRSFFQSVCVLGYCLAPVAGALIVCRVLLIVEQTKFTFFLRLLSTLAGFLWASYGKNFYKSLNRIFSNVFCCCCCCVNLQLPIFSSVIVNRPIESHWPYIQLYSSTSYCHGL